MRANEFIKEAKSQELRPDEKDAGTYAKRYDDIDTYYDLYRLGLAIAGGKDTPQKGPVTAHPTIWIRNSAEEEKLKAAEKVMGIKGTVVVPKGDSQEPKDTNVVSAIAKPKRNQYGI
jgi:hypothetical protein